MKWLVALLMMTVAFAGCSESSGPAEEDDIVVADDSFDEFDLEETEEALGVIRGVVIDASINPVGGVVVTLLGANKNVTTNEAGAFGFKDLEPGTYFVEATKVSYNSTQTSVEVVAGVEEPPVVKILMARQPGMEPAVVPYQFDGFVACAIQTPIGFVTGCFLGDFVEEMNRQGTFYDLDGGRISFIQSEAVWTYNLETAKFMCHRIYGDNGDSMVYTCGESKLVIKADAEAAAATGNAEGGEIEAMMWVTAYVDGVYVNVATQQDFQTFTHAFYNFEPSESWQFSVDGDPEVPN